MKKISLITIFILNSLYATSIFDKNFYFPKEKEIKNKNGGAIMKLLKKEINKKKLDGTGYKIIDTNVYNASNLGKKIEYIVEVNSYHNNVRKVEYMIEGNKWFFVKKDRENQLRFVEFDINNKKEFMKNNLYIKIEKEKYKLLYKVNNKFEPIETKRGENVKVITFGSNLKKNVYLIKVR